MGATVGPVASSRSALSDDCAVSDLYVQAQGLKTAKNVKSFPSLTAHRAALISVS